MVKKRVPVGIMLLVPGHRGQHVPPVQHCCAPAQYRRAKSRSASDEQAQPENGWQVCVASARAALVLEKIARKRSARNRTVRACSLQAAPAVHAGFLAFSDQIFFGAATAAYQIEGAAADGGRKPSIWDDFSREPHRTHEGATGDVACDHYYRFSDDVEIMAHLGLQAYRFSISWSRLIPDGEGEVNEEALRFYSDLIDALLAHNITPWVTLYHWDMPSSLQAAFGGWLGPKARITGAFGAFARACFMHFGDRVKHWITLNEPWCSAVLGYNTADHAPGRSSAPDVEPYVAGHNMLLAHAEAVSIFRAEFAASQRGHIGIALNADWRQPRDASCSEDVSAARRALDFSLGWFADPVFFGDYPRSMREACGDRLPNFTPEEQLLLRGSSDFFGINSYSSNFATPAQKPLGGTGYWADIGVEWWHVDPGWAKTDMGWPIVPWGFRELLLHVHRCYRAPHGIIVTENGCALEPEASLDLDNLPGALKPRHVVATRRSDERTMRRLQRTRMHLTFDDPQRVRFFRAHLSAVHAARANGANVRGYFAWSLLDNFEWSFGYSKRFGIVRVDYRTQRRTIKASARFLARVIADRGFDAAPAEEQFPGATF